MPAQRLEYINDGDWERLRLYLENVDRNLNPPVPQARVYNDANISIPDSTVTALTFNTERYDNGAMHSTSSNQGRLTAPITGLYEVGACVQFASNATGYRYVNLRLNGSTVIASDRRAGTSAVETTIQVSTEWQFAAGDWVDVAVAQSSGGALNVLAALSYSPEFWMSRRSGYTNQGV